MEIICRNIGDKKIMYPEGTSLSKIAQDLGVKLEYPIVGALVNNKVKELTYRVFNPKIIQFIDVSHFVGYQMYLRSLSFVLYKAVKDLYPEASLKICHSISGGKFCEVENTGGVVNGELSLRLTQRMQEIVQEDIPFHRFEIPTDEAIAIYMQNNLPEKELLFSYRTLLYTSVYQLDNAVNYYYGYLVPSTSYVGVFKLSPFHNGLLLQGPSRYNPTKTSGINAQSKLFNIFQEHKKWVNILGVSYVGDINKAVMEHRVPDLIKVSEALHEKKLGKIADMIDERGNIKVVLVSGPSSSGKTTFSKRLSVHLEILGYKPVLLSVDNYFVERDDTPKDEQGHFDFECLEALDLPLFNNQLLGLLNGEELKVPTFNFTLGKKEYLGNTLKLEKNSILIVEGIHGLNPKLTEKVDNSLKFNIFVSALTQVSVDSQNPIPTTDNRLIRRMVRDYRYRGYSALDTLRRWQSVRRGEDKWIFPFQENADIMFNSALLAELGILKQYAEPILRDVPQSEPEYAEAVRLLKFLSYFKTIPEKDIPPTSILREFFGGSSFSY
jgi:uridine kinase